MKCLPLVHVYQSALGIDIFPVYNPQPGRTVEILPTAHLGGEFGDCLRNHPEEQHRDGRTKDQMYADALLKQEPFKVSTIIATKLNEASHTLTAVERITDAKFASEVRSGKNLYRSPGLWVIDGKYVNAERTMIDVDKWKALHSAYVTFPAYGSDAKNLSTCIGGKCALHFQIGASAKCTSCENAKLNRLYKKVKKTITS